MGLGPIKNGAQQVITPRDGKAWCDTVNSAPMPAQPARSVLALGTCNADGSGFKPYDKPIERQVPDQRTGSYLWLGDFRL
jgi:hypothetical protein